MRQKTMLRDVISLVQGVKGVDDHAFRQPAAVDDALRYPSYIFSMGYTSSFSFTVNVTVDYDIYSEVERW